MNKVFCIGEALIDMICTDKGQTLAAGNNFLKKPGGAPTNVAAAIAALGGQVDLAAKVGNDPFGQQLIQVMQDFGVNTKYLIQDANYFTTMAFVSLLKNGERDFVFSRGADGQLSQTDLPNFNITNYSIAHFGSATCFLPGPLQQLYKGILHEALSANVFVSFDPNYRHLLFKNNTQSFIQQAWYFLERANFYKLSDEEALLLTQKSTLSDAVEELKQKTKGLFAITIGADGTLLRVDNNVVQVPSINITPVDTTGAGDAFVGALLYQLAVADLKDAATLQLPNLQQLVAKANKAGAKTCAYYGAMEAFKQLNTSTLNA
jgi:fructokinase